MSTPTDFDRKIEATTEDLELLLRDSFAAPLQDRLAAAKEAERVFTLLHDALEKEQRAVDMEEASHERHLRHIQQS